MGDSQNISEIKSAVRKEKLLWRKSLAPEEAREKSTQIAMQLNSLPEYRAAKSVLFYVSSKKNEVDTHMLITEAFARDTRVLVPVTDFDNQSLLIAEIKAMEELVPARFGLLEPSPDALRLASAKDAGIIIVPGVAFDRRGRRVGFGGGYYDRLLSTATVPSVALSYEGQLVEEAPVDSHDIPVDIIVTERAIYRSPKT
jgi:5-formyltetrahydrofolate cyclo-ligase